MARKHTLPNQTTMVRRLLKHYRSATPAIHAAGESWYAAAQEAAAMIYPARPDIAAAVIAEKSPRVSWSLNVRYARAIVHAANTGQEMPMGLGMTASTERAWSIATGQRQPWEINGPKTSRFYRNIMGDMSCATVDVWMMRAMLTEKEIPVDKNGEMIAPRGNMYILLERAIQRAAQIAGISAAMFQAIIWTIVRGSAA